MKYLAELNEVQQQAVQHGEGPLMIIAGAGSGKTRVLTYRIAHLLQNDVDAFRILSLTFTNKAAREMRERIEALVGTEAKNLWMGTFHSVFARILRIEAHHIGYPGNFTIYDTDDSKSLIRSILREEDLDPKLYKPSLVLNRISLSKNNFISWQQYQDDPEIQAEDQSNARPKLGLLYEKYAKRCFTSGAMDFDDILLKTYELFTRHAPVLNKYQQKFRYVLVDEYQDTNHLQYLIIRKLAAVHRNICVVGDDAQSIYAFRGANIKNILDYEKDYPDLAVYKLEQNYRSTENIVNAAGAVISKNRYQLKKELWTQNQAGSLIKVFKAQSESEEGRIVAQTIFDERMTNRYRNSHFAILYRTNAQSRAFEEWLRKLNISYQIIGGISFYSRKEVKDLLAYFRLAVNPRDEEALKRVINYPKRAIGKTTLEQLIILANKNSVSIWEVIQHISQTPFDARVKHILENFRVMIESFQVRVQETDAYEMGMQIARESGILKLMFEDKTPEGVARYENIQELLSAVKEFTERGEDEDAEGNARNLALFMQEVSLLTDADTKDPDADSVTMMTIHAAKGLEFPVVFVGGLEENLFPSQMSLQSREDLEEERRLFYVALTRAREKVYLSFAKSRFRWGTLVPGEQSRFIDEIDPRFLDYQQPAQKQKPQFSLPNLTKPVMRKANFSKAVHQPSPDFKPDDVSTLESGMQVEHNRFGQGTVVNVNGDSQNRKATIEFKGLGQKQILLKFAKMRIIN